MSLSLVVRKNIRDSEAKRDEWLAALKEATGVEFTFEVDFENIHGRLPEKEKKTYGDKIGSCVHETYLKPFVNGIKKAIADPMRKEALISMASNKKIIFNLLDKPEWEKAGYGAYCRMRCADGNIYMDVKTECFCGNVNNIGQDFDVAFKGSEPLTLKARIVIRDTEADRAAYMKTISDLAGAPYAFEVDWLTITPALKKIHEDRQGEVVNLHLKALTKNLTKVLSDEMGKEAFVEKTPAKIIKFVIDSTIAQGKACRFENGSLISAVKPDALAVNVDTTGNDIEKLL